MDVVDNTAVIVVVVCFVGGIVSNRENRFTSVWSLGGVDVGFVSSNRDGGVV